MHIVPSKEQWHRWSLPSKLTAIAFYISVITIVLTLISYVYDKVKADFAKIIGVKEIICDSQFIDQITKGFYKNRDGSVKIRYPQITHFLPNSFLDDINNEIKQITLGYLSEATYTYEFDFNVGVIMNSLVSIKMSQYVFNHLAVHGNTSYISLNIDPETNRIYDFFDIFDYRRNALTGIKNILSYQLRVKAYPYNYENFNDQSYVPRFYIKKESVEFIFSQYEIAAGFAGKTFVDISFQDIRNFIRKDGPLGVLLAPSGSWNASNYFIERIFGMEEIIQSKINENNKGNE